ncbi:MAG: septum formation initiator family protein [Candidatus Saganbacteria bacterium]|nr:septum formation initiator family protein [Candidatus Saganbacteria bacterium]
MNAKRIGLVVFVLIIIYFALLIRSDYVGFFKLKLDKAHLEQSLKQEQALSGYLTVEAVKLDGNFRVEELARTKLGLVKSGEKAYKIIETK